MAAPASRSSPFFDASVPGWAKKIDVLGLIGEVLDDRPHGKVSIG